jgi:hypothetical protein
MIKTSSILTLILWRPTFGQQANVLPGVAKLFDGFTDLISGPCNVKPDGCLEFFEGWYMHSGTAGTSDCQTTCIRYPSVRPELKCGTCDSVATTSSPPVSSTITETAPFFAAIAMPLGTPSPVAVAPSASSSPTFVPSDYPSSSPSTSPVSRTPSLAPLTVLPPISSPVNAVPTQLPSSVFQNLLEQLPEIRSSELSADALSFPSEEPSAESLAELSSYLPSSIPSNYESNVPTI